MSNPTGAPKWTAAKDALLTDQQLTPEEIAARTGRKVNAVKARRRTLGMGGKGPRRWTAAEDALLADPRLTHAEMAARTGRTAKAVRTRRTALGRVRILPARTAWILAKTCGRCLELLAPSAFRVHPYGWAGLVTYCHQCESAANLRPLLPAQDPGLSVVRTPILGGPPTLYLATDDVLHAPLHPDAKSQQ